MELRSLIRRYIPEKSGIKVLESNGHDLLGYIKDLNHKGFRINSNKNFKTGEILKGLLEYDQEDQSSHRIPFTGRCVWSDSSEFGFTIKDIPISEEKALDMLIEKISS